MFFGKTTRACILTLITWAATVVGGMAQTITITPPDETLTERLRREVVALSQAEDAGPADTIAAARGDYARLLAVLYERGYFAASVSIKLAGREAANLSILNPPASVRPIDVSVSLGQPFTFGRAEVSPLPPGFALPDTFATGQPAGTPQTRNAVATTLVAWRNAAHATAEVRDQSITADHRQSQLNVRVDIAPGPPLTFGDLTIRNQGAVRADRVRAIAGLPAGAPFHPSDLKKSRDRLLDTGAFKSVVLNEAPTGDTMDVIVDLEDAAPRRIGLGAEVSTLDGLSLEAFWLHRNYFGGAERLRFDLSVDGISGNSGGIDYAFDTTFTVPGFRRPDEKLVLALGLEHLDEETYTSDIFELSAQRVRTVNDNFSTRRGLGMRYARTEDVFGARRFRHLLLDFGVTWDDRDNDLNATRGRFAKLDLQPFIGIGDSETGAQLKADLRGYRAFGSNSVVAARLQLGSVIGSSLAGTPPDYLFFSGGGGTVRGQSYQSLGVETPNGTTGGRGFFGASAEWRQAITDTIGVVGFVDYGYVSNASDLNSGDSHAGAGLGARYITPLGPLRVDLGVPLGGDESGVNLYIGIGQAF